MAGLSNDAAARVLRRAAELDEPLDREQVGTSPDALRQAASEVGISSESFERALAEERLRSILGLEGRSGPRRIAGTDRLVAMSIGPADSLERVDAWMRRSAHLRRVATTGATVIYERRSDPVAQIVRGVRQLGGAERLKRPPLITVAATPCGDGSLVGVVAELRAEQIATLGAAGVVGFGGAVSGVVLAIALATPLFALIAPGALVLGAGVLVGRRESLAAAQRELDGALAAALRGRDAPGRSTRMNEAAQAVETALDGFERARMASQSIAAAASGRGRGHARPT